MLEDDQYLENPGPSAYVGLIPAAGVGSRLPDRELSKEMLAIGARNQAPVPVISHLLGRLQLAGIQDVTIVLRDGKQDVRDYLAGKSWAHMNFDIRPTAGTSGVPESVAIGLENNDHCNIAFGFPDILFKPADAFARMIDRLNNGTADVVLGLFPTPNPAKMDMVDADAAGKVTDIEIKPKQTSLDFSWILAVWKPSFTRYLCGLVRNDFARVIAMTENPNDNHLGQVFRLAIADGMHIDSLIFADGSSLDIGTPDDLKLAQDWTG